MAAIVHLVSKPTTEALGLVRLTCPLDGSNGDPRSDTARCQDCLRKLNEELDDPGLVFSAWATDEAAIQLACPRTCAAVLFKALHGAQTRLGLRITTAKSAINLAPMSDAQLLHAATSAVRAGLQAAGWWRLAGDEFLSVDAMAAADGEVLTCASVQLHLVLRPTSELLLLVKPAIVRFRHPFAARNAAISGLSSQRTAGTVCCVLPELVHGITGAVRVPSDAEAQQLRKTWGAAGFDLPLHALSCVVDVRFDDDEDAPAHPFPACCVLSQLGLDPVADRLDSPGVQAALAKLRGR